MRCVRPQILRLQNKWLYDTLIGTRTDAFFVHMANKTDTTVDQGLIDRLFSAGAHFGFSKSRRHPSMSRYLFGNKQGVDIFDLEKTSGLLKDAAAYIHTCGEEGKKVLLVGTKDEISDLVTKASDSANALRVTNRWIGGTITNFSEIKKRIDRMLSLKEQEESGELDRKYTKKERLLVAREVDKLEFNFKGIANMTTLPGVMIVVDPRHESIAVEEAAQARIPVVGIMSSDCNIDNVTVPVVVNDSHRSSVELALTELMAAYLEGQKKYTPKTQEKDEKKKEYAK